MNEAATRLESTRLLVQLHNLDLIIVILDERAECEAESMIGTNAPIHAVDKPRRLVRVDLLLLAGADRGGRRGAGRLSRRCRRAAANDRVARAGGGSVRRRGCRRGIRRRHIHRR